MIIDKSYFLYKPLFIPNVIEQPAIGTSTPSKASELTSFIDNKEKDLLLSFLGYAQTTELYDQFETNGAWKPSALQKWKDLVDGKEDWKGLRYTLGGVKVSLIANYVYFYFLGEDASTYGTTGVQQAEAANSLTLAPNQKQVNAWSKFLRMYGWIQTGYNQPTFFRNWNGLGIVWNGLSQDRNEVTLIDFLNKNSDVYDNGFITYYTPVNTWGL